MSTENERIKEVRKAIGLTLEKFGERVGMKKSSLSTVENGVNAVSNQLRSAVCREFGVDEFWLRTGEGEMFRPRTNEEILTEFAADLAFEGDESFKKKVVTALAKMDDETWAMFERWFWEFIKGFQDENGEIKKEQE